MTDGREDKKRLYGDIDELVTIRIGRKVYEVPAGLELLRCFQYLDFHIAYESFCWNASCENCATKVGMGGRPAKRALCCQLIAKEGMVIDTLPEGIEKPQKS